MVSPYSSSAGAQPPPGRFQIWVWIFPTFTVPGPYFELMSNVWAHDLTCWFIKLYDFDTAANTSIKNIVIQALKETRGAAEHMSFRKPSGDGGALQLDYFVSLNVSFHLCHCCVVQGSSEEASPKTQYTSVKMEATARWTCTWGENARSAG